MNCGGLARLWERDMVTHDKVTQHVTKKLVRLWSVTFSLTSASDSNTVVHLCASYSLDDAPCEYWATYSMMPSLSVSSRDTVHLNRLTQVQVFVIQTMWALKRKIQLADTPILSFLSNYCISHRCPCPDPANTFHSAPFLSVSMAPPPPGSELREVLQRGAAES